jgi:site-specific DNA-cytosine methylase
MLAILSLCDFTGAWSKPYRDAGYDVVQLDIKHGHDVRLFEALPYPVRGVLAAPPCTHLAVSGARWWADKGEQALLDAMAVVDACLRIVAVHRPQWWALENPVGRLTRYLGPPRMTFDPADYGDPYTKKTLLWGDFSIPRKKPVEATEGSKMHRLPPSPERAALRSVTPEGFSRAFYEANP